MVREPVHQDLYLNWGIIIREFDEDSFTEGFTSYYPLVTLVEEWTCYEENPKFKRIIFLDIVYLCLWLYFDAISLN